MTLTLRRTVARSLVAGLLITWWSGNYAWESPAVEFCLEGQFDLGARFQGLNTGNGETYPAKFCVISAKDSHRVHFFTQGKSNPDMDSDWAVSYLSEDVVRIVNRASPPDIEFSGQSIMNEAMSLRRLDPVRLAAELEVNPGLITARHDSGKLEVAYPGSEFASSVLIAEGQLQVIETMADLPLRGRVPVAWKWQWEGNSPVAARMYVDGELMFDARATRRPVPAQEFEALWQLSGNIKAIEVPGDRWPASINMHSEELAPGVHMVSGVRTGFNHLVVETAKGLVVADAPAGWVELHQVPATDLVPGMGISGLSENFINYLASEFPGKTIRAVAITHAHDDHAGGARAFAASGAEIYAPSEVTEILQIALNDSDMPADQLKKQGMDLKVIPVKGSLRLADDNNAVDLMVMPANPHVNSALGVLAVDAGVFFQSDLHVPNSEDDSPREDRAATECWFARWAVDHLPAETVVLNTHSSFRTPVSGLARYLESNTCRSRSGNNPVQ